MYLSCIKKIKKWLTVCYLGKVAASVEKPVLCKAWCREGPLLSGTSELELKAELHSKGEAPLLCFLPPSTATFGTIQMGGGAAIWSWQVPAPTSGWLRHGDFAPSSFPHHWAIHKAQRASRIRSREPTVKPQCFIAGFLYKKWRQQHPRADWKISWGEDTAGFVDR